MASGRARPAASGLVEALTALVQPAAEQAGVELEKVSVVTSGHRRVVRVVVDAEAGVTAEELAEVSRLVSAALDAAAEADPMGSGTYTLEVSTPGVGRPLTRPAHWRRAAGRLVAVSVRDGADTTGRLVAVSDADGVVLDVAGRGRVALGWQEVVRGVVQVEFRHPEEQWAGLESQDDDPGEASVEPSVEPSDQSAEQPSDQPREEAT